MAKAFSLTTLAVILLFFQPVLYAQSADRENDEQAIRAAASAYQDAFNSGDAQALAMLWVDDGEYLDQTGLLLRGRDVIAEAFKGFFEKNKGLKLEINIGSILFLTDNVASEHGMTQTLSAEGKQVALGRYSIMHEKRDGKWLMLSVHEQPPYPPSNFDKLEGLEWMVGNWVDEPSDSGFRDQQVIHIHSYWSVNRNFIIREFTATAGGTVSNTGTQRIGWDASTGKISSWAFDSKGGIITGTWEKNDEGWSVTAREILHDGKVATAVETVKRNDDGSQSWTISKRVLDGKSMPDESFKLVQNGN